ncbi:outer membrane transport energization protein ExbD [Zymomonas mobilis]|uniref:Outer membrane transport energization protein ExbD n=1 Tax=Zymomonas mobilis TaxID=542 RepID=A0A542W355_ZYMMB|nr:biopolymer transporter ExbD [Zymomonas mobilis]TQL18015.1 outer membrane transport energization protein ExbD [Zymomonas mobilis]
MGMSLGGDDDAPMSNINTTPLVDVMLVLLIIFLITVPVVVETVPVKLPDTRYEPARTQPEDVALSVRAGPNDACEVYWNLTRVNSQDLSDRAVKKLKSEIDRQGGPHTPGLLLPEVHIRGDVNTPYRCIGGVIYTMQEAGFAKVGFISEPPPGPVPADE